MGDGHDDTYHRRLNHGHHRGTPIAAADDTYRIVEDEGDFVAVATGKIRNSWEAAKKIELVVREIGSDATRKGNSESRMV